MVKSKARLCSDPLLSERYIAEIQKALPRPETTIYPYEPVIVDGTTAYLAGQIGKQDGGLAHVGVVGQELSVSEGASSARICAQQALSWLSASTGGLANLRRVLRMTCYVAHADGFDQISEVANGASDYLIETLGERGAHSRSVIGVKSLPRNAPVLVELTAALRNRLPSVDLVTLKQ